MTLPHPTPVPGDGCGRQCGLFSTKGAFTTRLSTRLGYTAHLHTCTHLPLHAHYHTHPSHTPTHLHTPPTTTGSAPVTWPPHTTTPPTPAPTSHCCYYGSCLAHCAVAHHPCPHQPFPSHAHTEEKDMTHTHLPFCSGEPWQHGVRKPSSPLIELRHAAITILPVLARAFAGGPRWRRHYFTRHWLRFLPGVPALAVQASHALPLPLPSSRAHPVHGMALSQLPLLSD